MVYVFQMFFPWDRRSQGTFPAVSISRHSRDVSVQSPDTRKKHVNIERHTRDLPSSIYHK